MTRILTLLILLCGLSSAPAGSMEQDAAPNGVSVGVPHAGARAPAVGMFRAQDRLDRGGHDVAPLPPAPPALRQAHLFDVLAILCAAHRPFVDAPIRFTYRANAPPLGV
jgi:hypothetical protein